MICLSFYNFGSSRSRRWSFTTPLVVTSPDFVLHAIEVRRAFAFVFTATLVVVGGGWSGRVWSVSRRLFGRGQLGDLSLEGDDFSFFGRWLVPGLFKYTGVVLVEGKLHQLMWSDVGVIEFPIILDTFHGSDEVFVGAGDVSNKEKVDEIIVGERLLMLP